ncbi:hypothetical protein [Streptomyces sp. JJ36]|uniref:hypothetical protein n=1 Tax=Streptomyces sp. JJ36 TaxID=2736645 RepID=UPI001F2C50F1|nr:hypothetical protein [Streptomyces sp. JJ36]MCF6523137.1 hypothetical protein [Streptomyces sp. JJ36]
MLQLLIGVLAVATAVRVFVPDALRLARRGLAAGVKVGVASLAERRHTDTGRYPATDVPLPTGRGERA